MTWLNKQVSLLFFLTLTFHFSIAQPFTHADTLRGSNGPGRDWWNVTKYDLHVKFNIKDSSISGLNKLHFKILKKGTFMQIDLQEPMILDEIRYVSSWSDNDSSIALTDGTITNIRKVGNAYFFNTPSASKKDISKTISVYYHGKPRIAVNPPWDGGIIWKKDQQGNPWVSIACQGLGASAWYPCKDYQGDEPDSAEMHITVPDSLICVGNGRLRGITKEEATTTTYDWAVQSPINNYNIIPYIGKYVHFNETYHGGSGPLKMDYWVLDYNLQKATEQFKEVPKMMKAFEYWFGPYPFYKDGYKLVEAPHLGMEHQGAIAYGNGYQNGYLGKDRSGTGWGKKWDYIIVHESGHEWFGNNITTKDIADMWVHEAFTTYSEVLFTEYYWGREAGSAYIRGIRKNIGNDVPIIGQYGVNDEGSTDMYWKGANMLHTIRQVINNDSLFRNILRGLNKTFYHQTVTGMQAEDYINRKSRINFSKIFYQYLNTTQVPILEYKLDKYKLQYRYSNCVKGFAMPLRIDFKGKRWIKPTASWQTLSLYPGGDNHFSVDPDFYINTKKVE